jgi:Putative prokaryotic signal transducing protein
MTTIATPLSIDQAEIIRSVLEAHGIKAFIPDELTANNAPTYLFASGGIRVQVDDDDAGTARALIADLQRAAADGVPPPPSA